MHTVSYDQALALLAFGSDVVLLLGVASSPLCTRAEKLLEFQEEKLKLAGFSVLKLQVDENSSKHSALACIQVPQVRVFKQGMLARKLIGLERIGDTERLLRE